MSWWSAIGGLFGPAKEMIEVFRSNAEEDAARGHAERMAWTEQDLASLQQFATEFRDRRQRTWWDSAIDGLNRLPRPAITLGILAFFVLAPLDPPRFLQIAAAYQVMPEGFWMLLSVIVAFYFGGRMQIKRQDMTVRADARTIAARLAAAAAAPATATAPAAAVPLPSPPSPRVRQGGAQRPNRVVVDWLHRQSPATAG